MRKREASRAHLAICLLSSHLSISSMCKAARTRGRYQLGGSQLVVAPLVCSAMPDMALRYAEHHTVYMDRAVIFGRDIYPGKHGLGAAAKGRVCIWLEACRHHHLSSIIPLSPCVCVVSACPSPDAHVSVLLSRRAAPGGCKWWRDGVTDVGLIGLQKDYVRRRKPRPSGAGRDNLDSYSCC